MRWQRAAALLGLVAAIHLSMAGAPQADALRQQVQATDALGALLDQQTADAQAALTALRKQQGRPADQAPSPTTRPRARGSRLSYDAAFHAAVQYIKQGGDQATDPMIHELSEDQLRRELAVLHVHNLGVYLQLNRELDELQALQRLAPGTAEATTQPTLPVPLATADDVLRRLRERAEATTRPARQRPRDSAIAALHHPEEATPQYDLPHQIKAAGQRAQGTEQPEPAAMTGAQVAATVMSGASLPDTFGVLSAAAPLNARRPGSAPLNGISPQSFPLTSFAPGGMPMPATPPGTPASVVPSPETLQTLAGVLGVTPDQAQTLLREGGTLSQMRQSAARFSGAGSPSSAGGDGGTLSTSAEPPSASDPRWRTFYYGPLVQENFWTQGSAGSTDPFGFSPGGGTYQRADPRVNQDFDLRLNGELDRRVNSGSDRRLSTHVDPRVNY